MSEGPAKNAKDAAIHLAVKESKFRELVGLYDQLAPWNHDPGGHRKWTTGQLDEHLAARRRAGYVKKTG